LFFSAAVARRGAKSGITDRFLVLQEHFGELLDPSARVSAFLASGS